MDTFHVQSVMSLKSNFLTFRGHGHWGMQYKLRIYSGMREPLKIPSERISSHYMAFVTLMWVPLNNLLTNYWHLWFTGCILACCQFRPTSCTVFRSATFKQHRVIWVPPVGEIQGHYQSNWAQWCRQSWSTVCLQSYQCWDTWLMFYLSSGLVLHLAGMG